MARCLIGVGANLGDREKTIASALDQLNAAGLSVTAHSRNYSSAPIGGPANQPEYLNAAAIVQTERAPPEILATLANIEQHCGRTRSQRWDARTLDLDLLLLDDRVIDEQNLVVPHPRLAFRRFALVPAVEVAPDWVHPLIGWPLSQLLDHIDSASNYAAVCDTPNGHANLLCQQIAAADNTCRFQSLGIQPVSHPPQALYKTRVAKAITLLRQLALPAAHQPWLLTDFWIEDAVIMARATGDSSDELSQTIATAKSTELSGWKPKLLVVLQVGGENARYQSVAEQFISETFTGPVLRVSGDHLEQAADEVRAAMAGMTAPEKPEF